MKKDNLDRTEMGWAFEAFITKTFKNAEPSPKIAASVYFEVSKQFISNVCRGTRSPNSDMLTAMGYMKNNITFSRESN